MSPRSVAPACVDLAGGATLYIQDVEILVDDEGRAYGAAKEGEAAAASRRSNVREGAKGLHDGGGPKGVVPTRAVLAPPGRSPSLA